MSSEVLDKIPLIRGTTSALGSQYLMFLFQLHSRAVGNDLGGTLHDCRRTETDIDDGIGNHGDLSLNHPQAYAQMLLTMIR